MYVNIVNCSRCKGDHHDLEAREFSRHPITDLDGAVWTHWTTCPTLNEPILITKDTTMTTEAKHFFELVDESRPDGV